MLVLPDVHALPTPTLLEYHRSLKASPLTFTDLARKALRQGYYDAYGAGWEDTGFTGDPLDEEMQTAVDNQDGIIGPLLAGLGALLIGGLISDAMLDSQLGQYAATLNSMYEQGFGDGVQQQGDVTTATWRKSDEEACALCDERDGTVWHGDEEHPYPGDGYYGDVCEGGPNCRCWLEYDIIPADEAATDNVPVEGDDIAAVATADLLALRATLLKYSPDQPRDDHGRFAGGGQDIPLEVLKDWTGLRSSVMREALAHPDHLAWKGSVYQERATVLAAAIEKSPETAPVLYRGIVFADMQNTPETAKQEFQVGKAVDLNLSSWSSDRQVALGFTGNNPNSSYMLVLDGGAKALNLGDGPNSAASRLLGAADPHAEKEWVTDGRFTVNKITVEADNPNYGYTVVHLSQEAVFAPPQLAGTKVALAALSVTELLALRDVTLKYSDDQPRGPDGRWTVGDVGPAPMQEAIAAWGQYDYSGIRSAMQNPQPQAPNTYGYHMLRAGLTLARAVQYGTRAPKMYRGLSIADRSIVDKLTSLPVGTKIDMNLSSWTTVKGYATPFATGEYRPGTGVLMRLASGATAFDIGKLSNFSENERITAGRFEVTGQGMTRLDGNNVYVVDLKQEAVFSTPSEFTGTKGAS